MLMLHQSRPAAALPLKTRHPCMLEGRALVTNRPTRGGALVCAVGDRVPEWIGAFLLAQHSPGGRAAVVTGTQVFGAQ
jgi:hypothetical protein